MSTRIRATITAAFDLAGCAQECPDVKLLSTEFEGKEVYKRTAN